jgi:hypothetical protein
MPPVVLTVCRVKKVLEVKRKHLAEEEAELKAQAATREETATPAVAAGAPQPVGAKPPAPRSALESSEDYDLLF